MSTSCPPGRPTGVGLAAWLIGAAAVGALAVAMLKTTRPSDRPPVSASRWTIPLPAASRLGIRGDGGFFDYSRLVAISATGAVAMTVREGDTERLYVKEAHEAKPRVIPQTDRARAPFFSPDGRWLGCVQRDTIHRVSLAGGAPQRICEARSSGGFDATWSPDGERIVYSLDQGLWSVPAVGGEPTQLTAPDAARGEAGHHLPTFAPDGESILFTVVHTPETHVARLDLDSGTWEVIVRNATQGQFIAPDRILFARQGELLTAPFDAARGAITGPAAPALQGVHTTPGLGGVVVTHFALADSGALAYVPDTGRRADDELLWVEPTDGETPDETVVASGPGTWVHPRLSPDETRVSVDIHDADGMRDIYILDLARDLRNRLTHDGVSWESEWSPSGDRLAVMSATGAGHWGVFLAATDFSSPPRLLAPGSHLIPGDWSPDGESLVYYDWAESGIWRVEVAGDADPELLLATRSDDRFPRLSPDGERMAYVADESGRREVFVRSYPDLGPPRRVSRHGGGEPVWSRDGGALYYREDDRMLAVDVMTGPEFTIGEPRVLFRGEYEYADLGHQHYDVSADGERFLMIRHGEVTGPSEVRVILNWPPATAPDSTTPTAASLTPTP